MWEIDIETEQRHFRNLNITQIGYSLAKMREREREITWGTGVYSFGYAALAKCTVLPNRLIVLICTQRRQTLILTIGKVFAF